MYSRLSHGDVVANQTAVPLETLINHPKQPKKLLKKLEYTKRCFTPVNVRHLFKCFDAGWPSGTAGFEEAIAFRWAVLAIGIIQRQP